MLSLTKIFETLSTQKDIVKNLTKYKKYLSSNVNKKDILTRKFNKHQIKNQKLQ
jgi:hypothetical protein